MTLVGSPELPSRTPFHVLAVCTGNICRSPQAALLLGPRLAAAFGVDELPDVTVTSAGTFAVEGAPIDEHAAVEARRHGVSNAETHRARQLLEPHVRGADLVLAMAREHRREAVNMLPSASRRSFTLLEFTRIVHSFVEPEEGLEPPEMLPVARTGMADFLRDVVAVAAARRGMLPPPENQAEFDVVDPYRRSARTYELSAAAISIAVSTLTADLARLAGARA